MSNTIIISNKGQDIASTNYWNSKQAGAGLVFLTANAGALRLLLPPKLCGCLDEMRTGRRVVIEPSIQNPKSHWDLIFDDGTDSPFSISISSGQIDRGMSAGENVPFAVWSKRGKELEFKAQIRKKDAKLGIPSDDANEIRRIMNLCFRGMNHMIQDRPYQNPLPEELRAWHIYLSDCGHCIVGIPGKVSPSDEDSLFFSGPVLPPVSRDLDEIFAKGKESAIMQLAPISVKTVLRGYSIRNGLVVAHEAAYHNQLGILNDDDEDDDFEY